MANNVRKNPVTGEEDYFFPMEIHDPSIKEYARSLDLEIGWARLGNRSFKAVFVPCKNMVHDPVHDKDVYVDTSSEEQRRIYLGLIRDELCKQDAQRNDGRCDIPDGNGGLKRCPCRVKNPAYTPENGQPKTLPIKCEGCVFEPFKEAHSFINVSALDHENENGEMEPFEIVAPESYYAGDQYLRLAAEFVDFIEQKNPKLTDLATLLVKEYNRSEAARELHIPSNTAGSRKKKLQELCREFLDSTIIF